MSREIKFRAWDKSRGRFFTCRNWVEFGVNKYGVLSAKNIKRGGGYVQLLIQQFTGLHDKNGKEIYESDLVRSIHFEDAEGKTHYLIHKIVWSDIYSGWIAVSQGDKEMPPFIKAGTIQLFTYMKFAQGVEIIGNIHENPELLK